MDGRPGDVRELTNMVISAAVPVISVEASDISLKNVKILSPKTTLFTLDNSRNFTLDNIHYGSNTTTFISATGDKTTGINVLNTPVKSLAKGVVLADGTDKNAVVIK